MSHETDEDRQKLALYRAQLEAMDDLLKNNETDEDLLSAKKDFEELVKLTEESLLAAEKAKLFEQVDELAKLGEQSSDETQDLSNLYGSLCHVVMRSTYSGRLIRHAVMIVDLESDDTKDESDSSYIKVRVLFIHPTESWMIPCSYFLQQRCTFHGRCKFSHGYLVDLKNILEYEEPDRSLLVPESKCLAVKSEGKGQDSLMWREAEVVSVSEDCCVIQFPGPKFDAPSVVDSVKLEEVIPLPPCDEDELEDVELLELPPAAVAQEETVEKGGVTDFSASWETHTKGIGSKLLAKMGWQGPGSGVGKSGQGLVEPIPVEVMPKGMSLDNFLRMRNESGVVTLGKGAIKMLKGKAAKDLLKKERKQDAINEQQKHKVLTAEEQFFSFLNTSVNVQDNPTASDGPSSSKKPKLASDKNVGVTLVRTAEKIRKLEQEIGKMNDSLVRLQQGRSVGQWLSESSDVERLKRRIADGKAQLSALQRQESQALKSRSAERDRKKLTTF